MNRLILVSNDYANARYAYDSAGRLSSKIYGNEDATEYSYDDESRVVSMITTNHDTTVQGWNYEYNEMGMVTNIQGNGKEYEYTYDAVYRITNETYNSTSDTSWHYDAAGNLVKRVDPSSATKYLMYNMDNELIGEGSSSASSITVTGEVDPGPKSNKWYDSWAYVGGRKGRVSPEDGTFAVTDVPVLTGDNTITVTVKDVSAILPAWLQTGSHMIMRTGLRMLMDQKIWGFVMMHSVVAY